MAEINRVVELPIGKFGLNPTENIGSLTVGHLVEARNLSFASGAIEKVGGASKYNSSALTDAGSAAVSIRTAFDWWPDFTTQRMIVATSEGKLLRDDGAGSFGTELASGLSDANDPMFVDGGLESAGRDRKLFFFNGSDVVQVLAGDGSTTANISTPPADWSGGNQPLVGVNHEGRIWGAGNANDPHRLYYSTTADHEDFTGTGAGSLSVYPGLGTRIRALVSFKGFLIALKEPRGLFVVDTSDPSDSNWRVFQSTESIGCLSGHLIEHMEDGVAIVDHVGNLWFLSAVDAAGNVAIEPFMREQEIHVYVRENIDFGDKADLARLLWYPRKQELHAPMPTSASSVADRDLIVDMNGERPRFLVNDRDSITHVWTRRDSGLESLVFADDDGFIWLADQEQRDKDGNAYVGEFETPPSDLSELDPELAVSNKNGMFLEVVMRPLGNWDLNVDIIWDGAFLETVSFSVGSDQAALGSFVLGTDALAGNLVQNKKRRIRGSGRRFSIRGRNSGAGENFSISRFFLHYIPTRSGGGQ